MMQPLQTRRFQEALARVQHLFMQTPGVRLTTADAAQMAGLDGQAAGYCFGTLSTRAFLRSARGRVRPELVGFALIVTMED